MILPRQGLETVAGWGSGGLSRSVSVCPARQSCVLGHGGGGITLSVAWLVSAVLFVDLRHPLQPRDRRTCCRRIRHSHPSLHERGKCPGRRRGASAL